VKFYPILGAVMGKVFDFAILIFALIGVIYVSTMIASHFGLVNVFYYIGAESIPEECFKGLK
jgi:hypothetical protein